MTTTFFVLDYKGGAPGAPIFVEGQIEEFLKNSWSEHKPDAAEHYRDGRPFNMYTKHQTLDFDYCKVHSLFIASELLLERLEGFQCNYVSRPLRVWEAKRKRTTRKNYRMIHVTDRYWCMDVERSEYQLNRDPETGELRYRPWLPGQRTYAAVYKLYVDEAKTRGRDLFFCEEAFRHITSERLAMRLQDLSGVELTPAADYEFPLIGEKIIDRG